MRPPRYFVSNDAEAPLGIGLTWGVFDSWDGKDGEFSLIQYPADQLQEAIDDCYRRNHGAIRFKFVTDDGEESEFHVVGIGSVGS